MGFLGFGSDPNKRLKKDLSAVERQTVEIDKRAKEVFELIRRIERKIKEGDILNADSVDEEVRRIRRELNKGKYVVAKQLAENLAYKVLN